MDCGPPRPLNHGTLTAQSSVYLSQAELECDEGYRPFPESLQATCSRNGTWTDIPHCEGQH